MKDREATRTDPLQKVIVWVVEDNDLFRLGVSAALSPATDIDCALVAASCEEALEALQSGATPPDIVLMDIGLPGIDGIEGTQKIRALSPMTRVLMLTVHEEDEKVFGAICGGASGYLVKPSNAEQIRAAVREARDGAAPINGYIAKKMLDMFARSMGTSKDYGLTQREKEILQLMVESLTMREIADQLHVSFHTIDTHVRNIYHKLHVHNRSGAVAKAIRERLV